jgi:Skp family chaperone for outer membrane proteins
MFRFKRRKTAARALTAELRRSNAELRRVQDELREINRTLKDEHAADRAARKKGASKAGRAGGLIGLSRADLRSFEERFAARKETP